MTWILCLLSFIAGGMFATWALLALALARTTEEKPK